MKNLNPNKTHSRDEFEKLVKGEQTPEHELDDFDRDALEGWKSSSSDFDLLKKSDKRFLKRRKSAWIAGLSIAVFVLIYIGVIFTSENSPKTSLKSQHEETTYVEKTDIETPAKIEELQPISKKKIIQAKTLKENFQTKNDPEQLTETKTEEQAKIELEVKKPEEILENLPVKTENRNSKAAEMYVHDLLIVDYRKHRNRPAIKTEQAIITGTSANLENRQSEIQKSEWKQVDIPYIDYITKSMGLFSKGSYKKALSRYLEILNTYPDDLNASFYGALCYYNLGEFDKAYQLFLTCKAHKFNNFYEEASWYGAKSLLLLKETDKAKIQLEEIVSGRGFYAQKAATELDRLQK